MPATALINSIDAGVYSYPSVASKVPIGKSMVVGEPIAACGLTNRPVPLVTTMLASENVPVMLCAAFAKVKSLLPNNNLELVKFKEPKLAIVAAEVRFAVTPSKDALVAPINPLPVLATAP